MTDWIRTRAKCNTRALFDQLKKVVQAHVDAANANIPSHRFTIDDKSLVHPGSQWVAGANDGTTG